MMGFMEFKLKSGRPAYINLDNIEAVLMDDKGPLAIIAMVGGEEDLIYLAETYDAVTEKIYRKVSGQKHG